MWLPVKPNAPRRQGFKRRLYVVHFVVNDRAGVIELRLLGDAEHDPDAPAVEKSRIGSFEKIPHAERVAVESNRVLKVVYGNGNLADLGQRKPLSPCAHSAPL